MKKIIGILGVAVIATTMFFSANNVNGSSSDISLASLIAINTANAELVKADGCHYSGINTDYCLHDVYRVYLCDPTIFNNTCYYNVGM